MPETYVGGVPEAEIQALFDDEGMPFEAGADRIGRFLRKLAALVLSRIQRGDAGPFAMFLLGEQVRQRVGSCGCTSKPKPLFSNGNDPIGARVWMMNARLAETHELDIDFIDDGDTFAAVITAGLGDLPAVTLDLRTPGEPRLSLFPDGCNQPGVKYEIEITDRPINPERMKAALDTFYAENLRTPMIAKAGHATSPWRKASKGVPSERPEEIIEGRLLPQLKRLFPRHDSRSQAVNEDGIVDISVYMPEPTRSGLPGRRCDYVLELKALADRTSNDNPSSTDHAEQIEKGYIQALAYSRAEKSLHAALCLFDMRAADFTDAACFADVQDRAVTERIDLWRWKLLRSSEEGRHVRYRSQAAVE
ncbi:MULTISPECIES: hypothetical protein [unclassified Novosphingobium]|uniref:hypothetical protein n=1 Tax=unclassified Novosphingobium TaxID=2644732 RepID=UPI00146AE3E7|nr:MULTISPECIES: hypothetical protein [unclassified Novosphingobium]NMN88839.1 hypothetical protein [Novosphingobium sp. SG916]